MFRTPGSRAGRRTPNALGLSSAAQASQRTNVYAAPFDALAFNGMQVNGSAEVSQQYVATAVTAASGVTQYAVDNFQFIYIHGAGTAVFTTQQVAPPGSPSFGGAFQSCMQITSTTAFSAPAAGDTVHFNTYVEGYRAERLGFGASTAQPVTIGFWIYTTIPGIMTLTVTNNVRSYLTNVQVFRATTWEYKVVTVPGDTAGTWGKTTGIGLNIRFGFGAGTTFQGTNRTWNVGNLTATAQTTNFFASNNNVVCITGIVAVPGIEVPSAQHSPFIMRPFEQELSLSQRYYRKSFPQGTVVAQNAGVSGALTYKTPIANSAPTMWTFFSPTMRTSNPTIVTYNPSAANADWRNVTAGSDVTVQVNGAATRSDAGVIIASTATVATLGDNLAIHYTADSRF